MYVLTWCEMETLPPIVSTMELIRVGPNLQGLWVIAIGTLLHWVQFHAPKSIAQVDLEP